MLTAIAIHYPKPEHRDEFIAFCRAVRDGLDGQPGLIQFTVCGDPHGRHIAGFSSWESEDAFAAALPKIHGFAPQRNPRWSSKPDDGFMFSEL